MNPLNIQVGDEIQVLDAERSVFSTNLVCNFPICVVRRLENYSFSGTGGLALRVDFGGTGQFISASDLYDNPSVYRVMPRKLEFTIGQVIQMLGGDKNLPPTKGMLAERIGIPPHRFTIVYANTRI